MSVTVPLVVLIGLALASACIGFACANFMWGERQAQERAQLNIRRTIHTDQVTEAGARVSESINLLLDRAKVNDHLGVDHAANRAYERLDALMRLADRRVEVDGPGAALGEEGA